MEVSTILQCGTYRGTPLYVVMEGEYCLATLTFNHFLGLVRLALAAGKSEGMPTDLHSHVTSSYPHHDILINIILLWLIIFYTF